MTAFNQNTAAKRPDSVGVLGYGVSGQASVRFLQHLGIDYKVYDERERLALSSNVSISAFTKDVPFQHPYFIVSPGFTPNHPWVQLCREAQSCLYTDTDFVAPHWRGEIIVVTGTNGKTSTAEFLAHSLRHIGKKAKAVGNNGYPFSRWCCEGHSSDAIAVCEMSSFQASLVRDMKIDVLIWTNFAEDHIDWHGSMESYFDAKWQLVKCLKTKHMFAGDSVREYAKRFSKQGDFQLGSRALEVQHFLPKGNYFSREPQSLNYALIADFWKQRCYPMSELHAAAASFEPPSHRLHSGVRIGNKIYWNDSKGTNFHAALAAVHSFDKSIIWIGGGRSKGGDIKAFVTELAPRLRYAVLSGENAALLQQLLRGNAVDCFCAKNLAEAVIKAHSLEGEGIINVVFSPGFSSFDRFKNYAERGLCFEQALMNLQKSQSTNEKVQYEVNTAV